MFYIYIILNHNNLDSKKMVTGNVATLQTVNPKSLAWIDLQHDYGTCSNPHRHQATPGEPEEEL